MRQLLTYARGAAQAAACLGLTVTLGGCEPVSLTLLGIGGSAAVNHQLSSMPSRTFALSDAAEAHRALESRRTTGATVLIP